MTLLLLRMKGGWSNLCNIRGPAPAQLEPYSGRRQCAEDCISLTAWAHFSTISVGTSLKNDIILSHASPRGWLCWTPSLPLHATVALHEQHKCGTVDRLHTNLGLCGMVSKGASLSQLDNRLLDTLQCACTNLCFMQDCDNMALEVNLECKQKVLTELSLPCGPCTSGEEDVKTDMQRTWT